MLRNLTSKSKTNSHYWKPWQLTKEPFPAFRGEGATYKAFLPIAKDFSPTFTLERSASNGSFCSDYCKIITTATKGTQLLVPCAKEQDQKVMLIMAYGGFRGGFSRIEGHGVEILWSNSSTKHCTPVVHLIAREIEPDGYILVESGRRCSTGMVEVFNFDRGYTIFTTEEFSVAQETKQLFNSLPRNTEKEIECCLQRKLDLELSIHNKTFLVERLKKVCPRAEIHDECYDSWHFGHGLLFTEENITREERKVREEEERQQRYQIQKEKEEEERKKWLPLFEAEAPRYLALGWTGHKLDWDEKYNEESYNRFLAKLAAAEAEIEKKKKKAVLEEMERDKKAKQEEEEAKALKLGYPQNVEGWCRTGGSTNAGMIWVIDAKGYERESDSIHNPRPRYTSEGTRRWNQLLPGEVALTWRKECTAAEHEFEVLWLPPEGLTEAQKERIAEIENSIEEDWVNRVGATGKMSPSIGKGWSIK